jgi:protein-S-isoprenylcysteine O-methyltransferase
VLSEFSLLVFRRARGGEAVAGSRGSALLLWAAILVAVVLGGLLQGDRFLALPGTEQAQDLTALVVILAGVAFRWWAILTLGRFFTVDVAIRDEHHIVWRGPYRVIRHPSYTGTLISFLGLGIAFGNWLSLVLVVAPITAAFLFRIAIEEKTLAAHFGEAWLEYKESTARLVPGLY